MLFSKFLLKNQHGKKYKWFKKNLSHHRELRMYQKNCYSNFVVSDKLFTSSINNPSEDLLNSLSFVLSNLITEKHAVKFSIHDDVFIVSVDLSQKDRILTVINEVA